MMKLSDRSGVSKQTIQAIEGGRGNPTVDTVERLASALGVSVRALITEMGMDVLHSSEDPASWHREGRVSIRRLDQVFGSGYVTNSLIRVEANRGRTTFAPRGRGTLRHCYILSGTLHVGPATAPVRAASGDFVRFPADTAHILEAITPIAVILACTTAPQQTMNEAEDWF